MAEKFTRENRKLNLKENKKNKKSDDIEIIYPIISIFVFLFALVLLTADFGNAGTLGQMLFNFFLNVFG
jgi:hypothetical protein